MLYAGQALKLNIVSWRIPQPSYNGFNLFCFKLGTLIHSILIIWRDNISVAPLATNRILHAYSKHVEIDFHFVLEKVMQRSLEINFVPSMAQIVDVFTKSLPAQCFSTLGK